MEPLAFAILNGLTPQKHTRVFYDERIEDIPLHLKADVVAINLETFSAGRAYHWAQHFRNSGAKIIFGGFHASAMPNEALNYGDSVVVGNAETTWPQVLEDLERNELKPIYTGKPESGEYSTVYDRSIFKGKKYNYVIPVQWGRGCIHNCGFCCIQLFFQRNLEIRPIQEVINEIATLPKKTIFLVDDNIFYSKTLLTQFCNAMMPLKRKWACQISADVVKHPELVKLMADSGCIMVFIGIETFDDDALKLINKSWNKHRNNVENAINTFKRNGIMIYGSFIFGFENDTLKTFDKAVDFAIRHKFFITNFNILYPMPGTPIYASLKAENKLTNENWWIAPGFKYGDPMVKPTHMTEQEFAQGCFNAKKKFISWKSILYRLNDRNTHLSGFVKFGLFLIGNLINRREIYKKQFQELGK